MNTSARSDSPSEPLYTPAVGLFGAPLLCFAQVDSTNRWTREHAAELRHGTVVQADQQSGGYGRHGRTWISPPQRNLYCSIVLRPGLPIERWSSFTQVAAISIAELLESMGIDAQVKWPNDLLWQEHKLCGMLAEVTGSGELRTLVLGFGLNVNSTAEDFAGLDRKATSLSMILGHELVLDDICGAVLQCLEEGFNAYIRDGFAPFLKRWRSMRNFLGHPARVVLADRTVHGTPQELLADGSLRFRADSGEMLTVYSGDLEI